jgi:hypothetical protein
MSTRLDGSVQQDKNVIHHARKALLHPLGSIYTLVSIQIMPKLDDGENKEFKPCIAYWSSAYFFSVAMLYRWG